MKQNQTVEPSSAESTAAVGHAPLPAALPAHNYSRSTAEPRVHPSQKPYSINELAILHGLSRRTVIKIYENEPGRLMHPEPGAAQKRKGRRYRTITVPVNVYERVKRRMQRTE